MRSHWRDNRRCSDPATNRPPQRAQQKQRTCYRCGAAIHLANATDCPASQAKSTGCGKTGHFSKVCRSAKQVREVVPEVVVLMTSSDLANVADRIQCNMTIETASGESATCELLVDTGSSVSIKSETLYNRHFSACPLTLPEVKKSSHLLKREYPSAWMLKSYCFHGLCNCPCFPVCGSWRLCSGGDGPDQGAELDIHS